MGKKSRRPRDFLQTPTERVVEAEVVEFICLDCETMVYSIGYHDGSPICHVCRFIRECPNLDEHSKRILRGEGEEDGKADPLH
jgi:hypothetical protein